MRLLWAVVALLLICTIATADSMHDAAPGTVDIRSAKLATKAAFKALRDAKRALQNAERDVAKLRAPISRFDTQSQKAAFVSSKVRSQLQSAQAELTGAKHSLKIRRVELAREKDLWEKGREELKDLAKKFHHDKVQWDKVHTKVTFAKVKAMALKKKDTPELAELLTKQKTAAGIKAASEKAMNQAKNEMEKHKKLYLATVEEVAQGEQNIHRLKLRVKNLDLRMKRFVRLSKAKENRKKSIESDLPALKKAVQQAQALVKETSAKALAAADALKKAVDAQVQRKKAELKRK